VADLQDLDEIDQAILSILTEDSRTPYARIARRLQKDQIAKLSTVGVTKRVFRLKNTMNIINKFTVRLDYDKMGLVIPILILLKYSPRPATDFVKDMECPELQDARIHSVFTVAHDYNLGILGYWESKDEYGKWKSELLTRLEGRIVSMNEIFILDFYKQQGDATIVIPHHISAELGKIAAEKHSEGRQQITKPDST
jgi:DNA-binding Lrp family transcriptional regulator